VTALDPGDIDRLAVESRRQGLPDYVEDPATIARVVRLILAAVPPSDPPDDLDPGGVEDVAALKAGMQDHLSTTASRTARRQFNPRLSQASRSARSPTGRAASVRVAAWPARRRRVVSMRVSTRALARAKSARLRCRPRRRRPARPAVQQLSLGLSLTTLPH
jgi:hypothetical protein